MKPWIFALLIMSPSVLAAQLGRVVVDSGSVLEFPQKNAKVISRLKKGSLYPVSNLPTEGFYKIRLNQLETGWISGNEVLVGVTAPDGSKEGSKESSSESAKLLDSAESKPSSEPAEAFSGDSVRVQVGVGLHRLSYGGLSDYLQGTSDLNFGQNYTFEFQKRMAKLLFLALRVELMEAESGDQALSDTTTQHLKQFGLPVQLGMIFTPIYTRKFRVGLGLYAGASVKTSTSVEQVVSLVSNTVTYNSIDPVGTLAFQATYGFGKAFGVFGEFSYQYQKTGTLDATTKVGTIPAFSLNYSGYFLKSGIEVRF